MLSCLTPFTINRGLPSRRNEIISLWVASWACPHSFFYPHRILASTCQQLLKCARSGETGDCHHCEGDSPISSDSQQLPFLLFCCQIRWEEVKEVLLLYCLAQGLANIWSWGAQKLAYPMHSKHSFLLCVLFNKSTLFLPSSLTPFWQGLMPLRLASNLQSSQNDLELWLLRPL